MTKIEMGKTYSPKDFEDRIYEKWIDTEAFKAEVNNEKEPYTIVLPPPNITGQLHMGHALDQTIQDILIRWKRMSGYETLWLPGTDHASIATEVKVVEKIMADEGKNKEEIGREEFLNRAWAWRDEYGRKIVNQMKKLGSSCDWSKERFTMDEGCNKAVTEVFVNLYERGLIYKGYRLINWCPDCKTTLSEAEVEHEEKEGFFWHVKYFVKDSDEYLEIATTRPETMLGDTAVAVNPNDDRYKNFVGKTVVLPILNKEIPVIADDYVDMEFGTGALKITPAHDPNDFEIGARHNLEQITVIAEDGTMNENAGKFEGMDRFKCRKEIVKELEEKGHLTEIKKHDHNIGTCYRCHTIIEPRLSDQWFVKMEELAKPAIDALKDKDLEFVPERFSKIYFHWLENIRDWCISRQLWWGHRIPAYYCDDCGETMVSKDAPEKCSKCGSKNLRQDEDALDTWFSSALWPFSTLGWPENTKELEYFYPTNVLVTGYDIIFFWVVRMVFSGLSEMKEVPFKHVYIHGLVRDAQGRKMSKSLGNGIDPLEVIDNYGSDALRFMLATGNSPGHDMRFQTEKIESSRNFINKLWNASRFVLMGLEVDDYDYDEENLNLSDRWILSRMNVVIKEITDNLEKFELAIAASKAHDFVWNEYCDWYIEIAKRRLYGEDKIGKETVQKVLVTVLKNILKTLHPFIPFVTEEIWQHIPNNDGNIIRSPWPVSNSEKIDEESIFRMETLMIAIKALRNARAEMEVAPSRKARLIVCCNDKILEIFNNNKGYLQTLASCSDVIIESDKNKIPEDAVSVVIEGGELFLPLDDLIDFEKEIERLSKEKEKLEKEVFRVDKKLANEGFVKKAPAKLIEEEKAKKEKYSAMLETVNTRIKTMEKKISK